MREALERYAEANLDRMDDMVEKRRFWDRMDQVPGRRAVGGAPAPEAGARDLRPRPAAQPVRPPRRVADDARGARGGPRPVDPHDRLRPPVRDLQARRPAVHRHRAPGARCCGTRSGRSRSSSPARPTPPTGPGRASSRTSSAGRAARRLRGRVFILEDYDIRIGRFLVQGVDVWLNNPRRPLEASGTSGMKASANGIPNLSRPRRLVGRGLDGRQRLGDRRPGHEPRRGRPGLGRRAGPVPDPRAGADPRLLRPRRDGLPERWIQLMRNAIASNIWRFSTTRMLHEYVERLYLPATRRPAARRPPPRPRPPARPPAPDRSPARTPRAPAPQRSARGPPHLAGPRDPQPPAGGQLRLGVRRGLRPGLPADARGARAPPGRPPLAPLHGPAARVAGRRAPGVPRAARRARRARPGRAARRRPVRAGPRLAPRARPRRAAVADGGRARADHGPPAAGRVARRARLGAGPARRRSPRPATSGRSSTTSTSARRRSPRRTCGARTRPRTRATC